MARPLRIEFRNALYHITSRGNAQQAIYRQEADRLLFLDVLQDVSRRCNWRVYAYCLMDNHYHLLVETPDGNLSKGMRHLNGVYTQRFNRILLRSGHILQGRYKAILVDKDSYLLELARYIVLNPVRAKMVRHAEDWPWSSYRATAGLTVAPAWLHIDWLLSVFAESGTINDAYERYRRFVAQGTGQTSPWTYLKHQIYLGDETFVADMQRKLSPDASLSEVPAQQKKQIPKPLDYYAHTYSDRNTAIANAYLDGGYGLKEIGEYFGLHYSRVSRIIKEFETQQAQV